MNYRIGWFLFFLLTTGFASVAYSQQDVDFHLNAHLLTGKKILKVKRDFYDPYLWVLAQNNQVYRVNSLTLAVDDYTAKFSAYGGLSFIDIAARSQDTVFVATNSPNVIEYKKGVLKQIGTADGITGTVNSVGVDYTGSYLTDNTRGLAGRPAANALLIATDNGMNHYDYGTERMLPGASFVPARVFVDNYRSEMFTDEEFGSNPDTVQQLSVVALSDYTIYAGYLWYGANSTTGKVSKYGSNINTAYYTDGRLKNVPVTGYLDTYLMEFFWGTDTGLFQVPFGETRSSYTSQQAQFLNGINVNKITSIYGLVSFGTVDNPGLIKENILAGTNNGLYFSNSNYWRSNVTQPNSFAFYHYDALGNKKIYDICVNATSYTSPICEDGVWVGADDGLYLLKPDYAPYIDTAQKIQAIQFDGADFNSTELTVCAGTSVKAVENNFSYTGNSIQWYKDGKELPAESNATLTITATGEYYALLYDPCSALHFESNHLMVNVISAPVFSFNYPDKIQQCGNTPTPLQTDNNPLYHYRWYSNGALNGDTTASYQVTQTGKYKVEVSACTNSWVPSKEVEVDLITLPIPQITTDKPVYCAGDVASLSVNVPVDNGYNINWYRDNVLLPADNNLTTIQDTSAGSYTVVLSSTAITCSQVSPAQQLSFTPAPYFGKDLPDGYRSCELSVPITITSPPSPNTVYNFRWYTNGLLNGSTGNSFTVDKSGKYRVEMSSCAGSWVSSHEVQIDLVNLPAPVVSADRPVYCIGDNATLSVNVSTDASYSINWYRDGELLTGEVNKTSVATTVAGSYTVSVINNLQNTDGSTCIQTSAAQVLTFNPPATVTIEEIIKTTICDGQIINLLAHYTGGTIKWNTGETADQISVITAGKYTATVTTAAGCTKDTSISVSFLPNPMFSERDTSVCPYKGQPITLTAPDGFTKYAWNGIPGGPTYQVTQPQTVQLTVTDINGCQTTLPIKVADHCPDIWIPNTFTPNGDSINDTWVIEGLDGDPTVVVSVFTRWGSLVFQSIGYGTPWNGQYQGKKLPAGVYYYLVKAKNGGQKFSGSLTIVY